jgi:sugar/nucleoside kinase (ribokinase family)
MRDQGYETSLDLVSRKGDPRYQPLVLPALRHLDYLVINELEAGEFSGLEMRDATMPRISPISPKPLRSCWRLAYASAW